MFGIDDKLNQPVSWLTLDKIALLCLCVFSACFIFYFAARTKNEKRMFITKICIMIALIALEIGRMIWFAVRAKHLNIELNVWTTINFHNCTIQIWLTVLTIFLSFFLKKDNKLLQIFYNILYNIATLGGIVTFIYPQFINSQYSIFHFRNLQSIISHILLITTPFLLSHYGYFKIKIRNFVYIPFAWCCVGSISGFASICARFNFAFAYTCELFDALNIFIAVPFHIVVVMLIMIAISFIILFLQCLYKHKKHKEPLFEKLNAFEIVVLATSVIYATTHAILFKQLCFLQNRTIGICMLIPFVFFVSAITIAYFILKKRDFKF
ncbi:MAG: YwaF family protein [Clostridia bacterium]|nr:YwaF family protein [Clostridia bacterium]